MIYRHKYMLGELRKPGCERRTDLAQRAGTRYLRSQGLEKVNELTPWTIDIVEVESKKVVARRSPNQPWKHGNL